MAHLSPPMEMLLIIIAGIHSNVRGRENKRRLRKLIAS